MGVGWGEVGCGEGEGGGGGRCSPVGSACGEKSGVRE